MSQPLVSILIPCFNAARWLPATLQSALAQTWPRTEIIVVDDGSTDGSLELARSFASDRMQIFSQSNAGASAARNQALRRAQGEFLQFLDADDLLSPGKIAAQLELLGTRSAGTLASCAWGRFTDDPASARFVDETVFHDFSSLEFLLFASDTGAMMHPSAWLVPRTIAERAGPWDETLSLNDDGEYFCRVVLASGGVAFCGDDRARSYYRSGLPGSLSQQRNEPARRSQFHSIELIERQIRAIEDSPRTRRAGANLYQRFIYDFYPEPADLIREAGERVTLLGGATLSAPPMGWKTAALVRLIGWKNVWKLKRMLRR